ncbi:MAG: hypothetical protein JW940_22200 [Polyangiaceae bacterium]|nr:hypothetical protein [Polyangiaceae bacterium]
MLTIAPLAVTLPAARSVVLENRLYVSVLGVALLASEVMRALDQKPRRMLGRSWWAAGVVAALFSGATLLYQRHFRDLDAFSAAAVQASPHSGLAAHLRFKASYGQR